MIADDASGIRLDAGILVSACDTKAIVQKDVRILLTNEVDAVYRLAHHLCPRSQDVDDLVQETYMRAFKAADRFQLTEFGPKPWLFKILYNLICSGYDAKKREQHALEQLRDNAPSLTDTSEINHADLGQVDWDSIDEQLKAAIDSLTLNARTTFLLCAVEGLKYREIAEVTAVPEGTVMTRLFRARADLTAKLGDYARSQGWTKTGAYEWGKNSKLAKKGEPPLG